VKTNNNVELVGAARNFKSKMKSFRHCVCRKRLNKEHAAE